MKRSSAFFFSLIVLPAFCIGCGKLASLMSPTYKGNGIMVTEGRPVTAFHEVELDGAYSVILTQAPTTEVRIEADSNLLAHISTLVSGEKLTIESHGNLIPSNQITVYISSPNYSSIESDGVSDIRGTTAIASPDLTLNLEGAGSYTLGLSVTQLKSEIEGSGTITLTGMAQEHSAEIEGSGNLRADSLVVSKAKIDISGSGNAVLNVLSQLDASISGSGGVLYRGPVKDVHTNISGSGSVNRSGD